jgi:hypothetical protein
LKHSVLFKVNEWELNMMQRKSCPLLQHHALYLHSVKGRGEYPIVRIERTSTHLDGGPIPLILKSNYELIYIPWVFNHLTSQSDPGGPLNGGKPMPAHPERKVHLLTNAQTPDGQEPSGKRKR